jgi:SAM-dependent methyltransferase
MEAFQPISVRPPESNRLLSRLRCVLDLQLLALYAFLKPRLRPLRGSLLDVGAGESPWREMAPYVEYVAADAKHADSFGMRQRPDIVYYDGSKLPFPEGSFDHVLCTEVLEHVAEPRRFLSEIRRVLRSGGTLILTVPWSARLHHLPHDYHRFSRYALNAALEDPGFADVSVVVRGNDICAISNKLLVW